MMSESNKEQAMQRVHIVFQRVQTWLFSVPRLRAMVGANVLLGETLRVKLPELARQKGSWRLARLQGAPEMLVTHDPLELHDDPSADWRAGIISRDGGHFEAAFTAGATEFAARASALLGRELPGLRFRVEVDGQSLEHSESRMSPDLPVFVPCQWSGRGLASVRIRQGDEEVDVSLEVHHRHEAAKRAENGQARDLVTLLSKETRLGSLTRPMTFKGLAGPGYLAVIHADGNSIGATAQGMDESERTAFFHRNRVLLRRAFKIAVDKKLKDDHGISPLMPLMLGGDDLLLVCRAESALPFVVALCDALAEIQQGLDSIADLTLGVGVVIARPMVPIHRLHDVAEELAASAKRRFRGQAVDKQCSVVDWAVDSSSRVDDPLTLRRRDWVRGKDASLRVLSRRPMDVLGSGPDTLQGLLAASQKLERAPRSQLRYLVDQLHRGKVLSELAFVDMSGEAKSALRAAGVKQIWERDGDTDPWLTSVLDLVEVFEIERLGRAGTVKPGTHDEMREEAPNA
jgi:hypothetical protein